MAAGASDSRSAPRHRRGCRGRAGPGRAEPRRAPRGAERGRPRPPPRRRRSPPRRESRPPPRFALRGWKLLGVGERVNGVVKWGGWGSRSGFARGGGDRAVADAFPPPRSHQMLLPGVEESEFPIPLSFPPQGDIGPGGGAERKWPRRGVRGVRCGALFPCSSTAPRLFFFLFVCVCVCDWKQREKSYLKMWKKKRGGGEGRGIVV